MPRRHGNLIEQIASMDNLRAAYERTARGKRETWGYLEFKEFAELNLRRMHERLLDGDWQQGDYREFWVHEPKARLISALDFTDRLAQHALVAVIGPLFEAGFLPYSFACRKGMGTHAGVRHIQAELRRTQATHFLKTDFSRYFYSIDRPTLHSMIERKIKCPKTLRLIRAMVPEAGKGLPIGSLTSQLFANLYGNQIDRLVHFDLGARHWGRYMDDMVILSSNPYELRRWKDDIEQAADERLQLRLSHWHVSPVSRGINFLGYRIWPRHKLLRKRSVTGAKRKIKRYLKHNASEQLQRFIASWRGHAAFADTCNLFNHLEAHYGISCHQQPA